MIQNPKTLESHRQAIIDNLAQTGIRQLAPGGKARAIADAVADQLAELDNRKHADLYSTTLPYATGPALDSIGATFGVHRIPRQDVSVSINEGNVVFYVKTGTFGSINGGNDITIPAGTKISTSSPLGATYIVSAQTILPATGSVQAVSAYSSIPGFYGNLPSGTLVQHNFSSYTDFRSGSLLVTNAFPITAGREQEDDESYRYRINLRLISRSPATEPAIRLALLELPGVRDIVFSTQAGHFYVYVYAVTPLAGPQLIKQAQDKIDVTVAYPIKGTVVQPDLVGISLYTTIRLNARATPTDKLSAASAAVLAAEDYINNLAVGETLILNELADKIRNADAKIMDVGEPNKQIPEIFIWRQRADGTRYSRFLVGDYTPAVGERIYVESSRPTAISIQSQ